MLIGFTGRAGAGKDTSALYFNDAIILPFSKPLKDASKSLFNLSDEQLHDPKHKEIIDPNWNKTPRQILQWLGTEILREQFDKDFFIKNMKNRIMQHYDNKNTIIITDIRFDNEAELIKQFNGIIVEIKRDSLNVKIDNHASELGIDRKFIDYTIENNGTIEELHQKVDLLVKSLKN